MYTHPAQSSACNASPKHAHGAESSEDEGRNALSATKERRAEAERAAAEYLRALYAKTAGRTQERDFGIAGVGRKGGHARERKVDGVSEGGVETVFRTLDLSVIVNVREAADILEVAVWRVIYGLWYASFTHCDMPHDIWSVICLICEMTYGRCDMTHRKCDMTHRECDRTDGECDMPHLLQHTGSCHRTCRSPAWCDS